MCYAVCSVNETVDAVVEALYADVLDAFWPPERALVETGYETLSLPGTEVEFPALSLKVSWNVDSMLGYLRTWSASKRYQKASDDDPVSIVAPMLREAWGDGENVVRWPLHVRATRL